MRYCSHEGGALRKESGPEISVAKRTQKCGMKDKDGWLRGWITGRQGSFDLVVAFKTCHC